MRRIAARYGFDVRAGVRSTTAGPSARSSVDKRRLERILANLLDNAQQHGGGPTRIAIDQASRRHRATSSWRTRARVSPQSERTRIFERFARGTAARHRIGTGLGLALVAEHAAVHGGSAWVEDRPGGGARFVVSFPADGA